MTIATLPFDDLTSFGYRAQHAATDALDTWFGVVQASGEAAESQARHVRQLLHGMFDLVDQAFRVEREVATYLTIASQVSATAADSARELTDIALAAIEASVQAVGRTR